MNRLRVVALTLVLALAALALIVVLATLRRQCGQNVVKVANGPFLMLLVLVMGLMCDAPTSAGHVEIALGRRLGMLGASTSRRSLSGVRRRRFGNVQLFEQIMVPGIR